ncbi:hypothetical protein Tco_0471347 [Tanacetum coccineum]
MGFSNTGLYKPVEAFKTDLEGSPSEAIIERCKSNQKELAQVKKSFETLNSELESSIKRMQDIKQELGVSASDAKKYEELHHHSVSSACEIASSINDKRRREFIAMKWGFLEAFVPERNLHVKNPTSLSTCSLHTDGVSFEMNAINNMEETGPSVTEKPINGSVHLDLYLENDDDDMLIDAPSVRDLDQLLEVSHSRQVFS